MTGDNDDGYLNGPKGELLRLLEQLEEKMGLTDPVIRALVDGSDITYPPGHIPLLTCHEPTQQVRFVVQGCVKIVCRLPRYRRRLTLDLVGKGEFLCLPPANAKYPPCRIEAVVHEGPVALALIPRNLVARAIGQLPEGNIAQLVSRTWRSVWRLAVAKTSLLALPTGQRLIRELARLAGRFGRIHDDCWTRIEVRLRQDDLASLIARSRSNVSRAFTKLRKDGSVDRVGGRILIATSVLHPGGPPHSGRPHAVPAVLP